MSSAANRRAGRRAPRIPEGERVAAFTDYEAARKAVMTLAEADFPIKRVSIIGSDLTSVERITGMVTAGRAAGSGLMTGLMLGMFAGLVSLIVNPGIELMSLLAMGLIAVGVGVLWSVVSYLASPSKRNYTSVMQTIPKRFELVVPAGDVAEARRHLGALALRPEAPVTPTRTMPVAGAESAQPAQIVPDAAPAAPIPHGATATDATPARPRTYGEAQDELKRQEALRAAPRDRDAAN
ncbi:hypothetical protein M3D15_07720 [Pseudoclavibacter alba]|uniref:General stress protein 17M-like domain-containing protein n=1 Tax=Pseudoclavibacter albus TaxID=272241 RepID=A0ABT2HYJ0_9MICO|nr:general stress protein [Pseudoclavibacter alba]MCT2043216.1 hypothetical protein [Pseudoclavibacter alba]